jgi:hypothetical protein
MHTPLETIDILSTSPVLEKCMWQPVVGQETLNLLKHLGLPDDESRERICREAVRILGQCVNPEQSDGSNTGLVVGYVQSGKTMSFTTVTALARDNKFPIVIVIAGTSIPLFKQSESRLGNDLRLGKRHDRKWKRFSNPKMNSRSSIENTLAEWTDASVPDTEKQTILITVMKNHRHLQNLNQLLSAIHLEQVPVIIIDDEADQASLNAAVKQGESSTTYQRIIELRQYLPHHTFLQYTATPQAPLLINLIDMLSPRFVELLTPGEGYAGGKDFFSGTMPLVRMIPDADIPSKDNLLAEPPESLLQALRLFFLGVARGYMLEEAKGNRSMMVHPSHKTVPHAVYKRWVDQVKSQWKSILELDTNDFDKQDLLTEFRAAYQDLQATIASLASFDELAPFLLRAIRNTNVVEVNSRQTAKTPQIDWKNDYSHILVGGQAMDRGFTVEGLTVTYMPRGKGMGYADSIQQRARFFGYKQRYLGYCRVFVEDETRESFRAYVEHEEDMRARLLEHQKTTRTLSEWKRAFFLDKRLKPTRDCVLDMPYIRGDFQDEWFDQKAPHDSDDAIQSNRSVVEEFLKGLNLVPDAGHPDRTEMQRHRLAQNIPLADVIANFLLHIRMTRTVDSQNFTGLLLQIQRHLDNFPSAQCSVYWMSEGRERERRVNNRNQVTNLFQGANPSKGKNQGKVYPGDRYIRMDEQITVQIHMLRIKVTEKEYHRIPTIAVWIPKMLSPSWLVQEQGASRSF